MIPESEILECPEHEVKSKIGNIFTNKKVLEEYSKIYKIDPYFCGHYKQKIQVDKTWCEYILFWIDVYFTKYLLAIEIEGEKHVNRDLIFEEKRQALEKKLDFKFIRINTSKEGYDADYEVSRIKTFISEFKDKQLKKSNKKNKRTRRHNKRIKTSINKSKCLKWFVQKILLTL